jgi:hypothetical protein
LATDPSFALSSIKRANYELNVQPTLGSPIGNDPKGFKFPKKALVPEGKDGVQGTDPYTPMLRAYANDNIEVRAIVGAVDSIHSFGIQGVNWFAEPSYPDSGFRDIQGMGISEHFEMLFTLAPGEKGRLRSVDRVYSPSNSSMGLTKGAWGILRSYDEKVPNLAGLSNNPPGKHNVSGFYDLPAGHQPERVFDIAVSLANDGQSLQYEIDGAVMSPLVLRAVSGDWIKLTLTNNLTVDQALQLKTQWGNNKSGNASSDLISPYHASAYVSINPRLIAYDATKNSGLNVGLNGVAKQNFQTVAPGKTKSFTWYAGNISLDESDQRMLTPVEFGGVNLVPSGSILQASYGLVGALII